MRYRWPTLLAIVGFGVVLGLAIGGLPNHRADAPLQITPSTSTSIGSLPPPPVTSTTPSTNVGGA